MWGVGGLDKTILKFQAGLAIKTVTVAVVIAVLSFFLLKEPKPFIWGLVVGVGVSLLQFRQMAITMEKAVKMHVVSAQRYAAIHYFIRFITMGAVLYFSIKSSNVNYLGVIIGFLLLKFVIFGTNILNILFHK